MMMPESKHDGQEVLALKALLTDRNAEIAKLRHQVQVLEKIAFGPSSEKRSASPDRSSHPSQGHLFAADLLAEAERVSKETGEPGTVEPAPAKNPSKGKKRGGRRKRFPDQLPRVTTRYELAEDERRCACGHELHEIGHETRSELERVEIAIVHEIQRAKYGCRACESTVRTAQGPPRVIDKGLLGPGFLAHVAVEHFGNHMPYHRLEKKYASEGLELSRSVLERSMAACADMLEPIWKQHRTQILASAAVHTDDTPVTIARGSQNGSRKGRAWVYLDLEDRHFYHFTESRARDGPFEILGDYTGYIHADAYPGYDQLFLPDGATEVACMAHARRKFVDAEASEPELAAEALERIGELYGIERYAKDAGLDAAAVRELRQRQAQPILDGLAAWLAATEAQVLPKSPMATAVRYTLSNWKALTTYIEEGYLAIDNNPAERALRPIAVGRKNWLFVQNVDGGRRMSILLSLVNTAKAIGIDPAVYLRDVLLRIGTETDVTKLTPHGWRDHFADQVRAERDEAIARLVGG